METETRIEKKVMLKAPVARVWRAITDAAEFGKWFGIDLAGPFVAGKPVAGNFRQELNEAAIVEQQRKMGLPPSGIRMPEKGATFCTVERIEPETYFSFRWIPYGIDAEVAPDEPTTLVEFRLEPATGGTLLTITESGFERVPLNRRRRAFLMNDGGWAAQAENLKRHVERQ
jgi:uncharacterized protein YndB with AHSA1/START domain